MNSFQDDIKSRLRQGAPRTEAVDRNLMRRLMASVFSRSRNFLESEAGITVTCAVPSQGDVDNLIVYDTTVIMGLGGTVNALVAFSFSDPLLQRVFEIYAVDIPVPDDEKDYYVRETAAEIVNTIVGHCTADFDGEEQVITLSPPLILQEGKAVRRPNNAVFACLKLETAQGNFNVNFLTPRNLFDQNLDPCQ